MNPHSTAWDSYVVHNPFVYGRYTVITGIWFSCSTMWGLGILCVWSGVVEATNFLLRKDMNKKPPFTCPWFHYVPLGILDLDTAPMPFEFLSPSDPPRSLKFNMMVDDRILQSRLNPTQVHSQPMNVMPFTSFYAIVCVWGENILCIDDLVNDTINGPSYQSPSLHTRMKLVLTPLSDPRAMWLCPNDDTDGLDVWRNPTAYGKWKY